jgi:membrane-associated phospholipid phosphatase
MAATEIEALDRRWWLERIGFSAAAVLLYLLYFPVGVYSLQLEGNIPVFWLDHAMPFYPGWAHIYVMVYAAAILPLAVVRHRRLFRRVALAYLFTEGTALAIFLLYPVHMVLRPEIVAVDSFTAWGLKLCFTHDVPSNCLPSLHVADAVLGALCVLKVDRRLGRAAMTLAVLIGASTMLLKQHYFIDVVTGFALAGISYRLFVAPFDTGGVPDAALRFPWRVALGVPVLHCAWIASCYISYLAGWQPW